jgi:hypothetical protein
MFDMTFVYVLVALFLLPFFVLCGILVLQACGVMKRVPYSYNLRNLVVRWQQTLLVALAFTMVVGLMMVMMAFVNGLYQLTSSTGIPGNVIVLADGATDELFSNLGYGEIKEIELRPEVLRDPDTGKPLASWEVYVVVNQPIAVRRCPKCNKMAKVDMLAEYIAPHPSKSESECSGSGTRIVGTRGRRFLQVRGIEDPVIAGKVHNLPLKAGAWYSQAGVEPLPGSTSGEQAIQAVIGDGLARELGPDQDKEALEVGDVFDLGNRRWIVSGILSSRGSTFDSEIWAKFQIAGEMFGKSTYTTVVLRTADGEQAKSFAKDLSANFKKPAVGATPEPEYYERLNTTNQQFLGAILVVAAIMAIGGVLGVTNTMFAAISQRTKDIGVLRILGYTPLQVLMAFFLEALMLALIGGILGVALGSLSHGYSASSIMSGGQGGGRSVVVQMTVDLKLICGGMGFAVLMGYLGGFLPALSAMRLKPLDAVR